MVTTYRIDDSNHLVINARTLCRAVEEYRIAVIYPDGPFWRLISVNIERAGEYCEWLTYIRQDRIDRVEAREEPNFALSRHFYWNAWIKILGADNGVIHWIEIEFNYLARR